MDFKKTDQHILHIFDDPYADTETDTSLSSYPMLSDFFNTKPQVDDATPFSLFEGSSIVLRILIELHTTFT